MWAALKSFLAFCWQFVLYYIKGAGSNETLLRQREAELAAANEHVRVLEEAAAKDREERLKEVDEKAAAVVTSAEADELLRSVTRARHTETN